MSNGYELSSKHKLKFNDQQYESLITAEMRALGLKYTDPLTLNFKLMIDFDKPYGLFADEDKHIDSALAYLKRIGENIRHDALVKWIENFKLFIRNYDFLILNCDGVDEVVNAKPHEAFTENNKITIQVRETVDMLCQSLLTQYRAIWYDNTRNVEVLPINLRKFDISILIYSSGYYNMMLYDIIPGNDLNDSNIETKIFPTIRKLSDNYFIENNSESYKFNHHLIVLGDAEINNEESGKSFFGEITNEMSGDSIKNTIVFNYRFAGYKGIFNNLFGEFDLVKLLSMAASHNKLLNVSNQKFNIANVKSNFGSIVTDTLSNLSKKPNNYLKALTSPANHIGNAFATITSSEKISDLIKTAINKTITNVENKYIYSTLTNMNNFVSKNFSTEFHSIYGKYFEKENTKDNITYNTEPTIYDRQSVQKPSLSNTNIYNRNSF